MKRIGIFIDGANLYASAKALNFRVDFTKLLNHYKGMGDVAHAFYFTALPPKDVEHPLRKMIDYVEYNGFSVIQKETKEYVDADGKSKLKGNMDVEIAVYAGEVSHTLTDVVLFSGDGDFRCLLESLQRRHGIRCTVVSARSLVANELRRQANEYVDLNTLRDKFNHGPDVERQTLAQRRYNFLNKG
jgi:uncharacterized LabA/DUF88 family protein